MEKKGKGVALLLDYDYRTLRTRPSLERKREGKGKAAKGDAVIIDANTFLAINCHFCVNSNVDISSLHYDPDLVVPWEGVEHVVLQSTTPDVCSICLDDPMSPVITKCGHVYCLPCVLSFMGTNSVSKCPVCHLHVKVADLRTVSLIRSPSIPACGELVTLVRHERYESAHIIYLHMSIKTRIYIRIYRYILVASCYSV